MNIFQGDLLPTGRNRKKKKKKKKRRLFKDFCKQCAVLVHLRVCSQCITLLYRNAVGQVREKVPPTRQTVRNEDEASLKWSRRLLGTLMQFTKLLLTHNFPGRSIPGDACPQSHPGKALTGAGSFQRRWCWSVVVPTLDHMIASGSIWSRGCTTAE